MCYSKLTIDALESLATFSTGLGSKPHGLTSGDFNNDGHLDIAVANNGKGNIGFLFLDLAMVLSPVKALSHWAQGSFRFGLVLVISITTTHLDIVLTNNILPTSIYCTCWKW